MKVTLVQPPLIGKRRLMLTPPLGLMLLGTILRDQGHDVSIVDLNLELLCRPELDTQNRFYPWAQGLVQQTAPDALGFTSMGVEAHHCLELARLAKECNPDVCTLLGGAHFASHAVETLDAFPWIDYVAIGAAEASFPSLLRALDQRHSTMGHKGFATRDITGRVIVKPPDKLVPLDEHPLPDYDLIDLHRYFEVNPNRYACVEHARGCQLRCTYCYSENHWGHGESRKSNARVVAELTELSRRGVRTVFFVADNFLTDPRAAGKLCEEIAAAELNLTWSCYGTLAQVTPEMLDVLAAAGCTAIFIGVDAVSSENQRRFKKTYFKTFEALATKVRACIVRGILPMCSLLFTDEDTHEGREATLQTALFLKIIGSDVCLNPLVKYRGTRIQKNEEVAQYSYTERQVRLLFDSPKVNEANRFARSESPSMFPSHRWPSETPLPERVHIACAVTDCLLDAAPLTVLRSHLDEQHNLTTLVHEICRHIQKSHERDEHRSAQMLRQDVVDALGHLLGSSRHLSAILDYELKKSSFVDARHLTLGRRIRIGKSVQEFEVKHGIVFELYVSVNDLMTLAPLERPASPERHLLTPAGISALILCDNALEEEAIRVYGDVLQSREEIVLQASEYRLLRTLELLWPRVTANQFAHVPYGLAARSQSRSIYQFSPQE